MAQTEKTIIIPETDQERFIDFSAFPDGAEWFGRGVKLAGISRLSPAYLVRYPNAKRFLVMVCSRGRFEVECDHFKAVIGAGDFVLMVPGALQYLHALEPAEMAFLPSSGVLPWAALPSGRDGRCTRIFPRAASSRSWRWRGRSRANTAAMPESSVRSVMRKSAGCFPA